MKIAHLIFIAIIVTSSIDACVTYNPKTGVYTVDPSGCVDR